MKVTEGSVGRGLLTEAFWTTIILNDGGLELLVI
jgi:hypothetical protein